MTKPTLTKFLNAFHPTKCKNIAIAGAGIALINLTVIYLLYFYIKLEAPTGEQLRLLSVIVPTFILIGIFNGNDDEKP